MKKLHGAQWVCKVIRFDATIVLHIPEITGLSVSPRTGPLAECFHILGML
jgi:hypothetical protein